MKLFRTPNYKKSIKARTTSKWKRSVKRNVNPFYGKKNINKIKNPKKHYNDRIYQRFTISIRNMIKEIFRLIFK